MGIVTDIIKGLPLSAVQADKLAQLEKQMEKLETENAELRKIVTGCPRCRSLNWAMASCESDPVFGDSGGSSEVWACPDCGLTQRKIGI